MLSDNVLARLTFGEEKKGRCVKWLKASFLCQISLGFSLHLRFHCKSSNRVLGVRQSVRRGLGSRYRLGVGTERAVSGRGRHPVPVTPS